MALKPVVELGVAEAYAILAALPEGPILPPLEAIENEDWGRDFLLGRFEDFSASELAAMGLRWDEEGDGTDSVAQSG
ncbi:hypothetical protein [Paludisphaera soli]|uniref:hypothetical protein n=1 Tax=Paludisphaera soli TaxID=2712865 RepID=UPI0013ECB04F|nr:hypothetical protein [Paludisphaera soli]